MNRDFMTAMRRSLEQTRAGNPAEATRLIQAALKQGAEATPSASGQPLRGAAKGARAALPRQRLSQVIAGLARRPVAFTNRAGHITPSPDIARLCSGAVGGRGDGRDPGPNPP